MGDGDETDVNGRTLEFRLRRVVFLFEFLPVFSSICSNIECDHKKGFRLPGRLRQYQDLFVVKIGTKTGKYISRQMSLL